MKNRRSKIENTKIPWPTKDAMDQVYKMKLWGGSNFDFYSGKGSHDPKLVLPYVSALIKFLTSFKNPLAVCDLGCGDFNVGKELVKYSKKYIGVDIVYDLIQRNKEKFQDENLEFHCLDIATADLPSGDCAILRQVLQHLSNTEVKQVLSKLSTFKYVILTEHIPAGNFIANKEIISGQGIRLKKQSGLDLLAAPFYFKVKEKKQLLSITPESGKGVIITTLYKIL